MHLSNNSIISKFASFPGHLQLLQKYNWSASSTLFASMQNVYWKQSNIFAVILTKLNELSVLMHFCSVQSGSSSGIKGILASSGIQQLGYWQFCIPNQVSQSTHINASSHTKLQFVTLTMWVVPTTS